MNALAQFDLFAPAPVKSAGHRIVWGKEAQDFKGYVRGTGLLIEVEPTTLGARWRYDYQMPTSGGCGPWREVEGVDVDELLQRAILDKLKWCADHTHGGWRHDEGQRKAHEKMAAWLIDQLPPIFFPEARAAERYAEMCAVAKEREDRRCAMLRAKHDIEKRLHAAAVEGGFYAYPELIQDAGERAADWGASFKGEWCISGSSPGGLEVVIYAYHDRNRDDPASVPAIQRALEFFTPVAGVPVRLATPAEHELCHSDRRKVAW